MPLHRCDRVSWEQLQSLQRLVIRFTFSSVLVAAVAILACSVCDSHGAGGAPKKTVQEPTAAERAIEDYNRGLKHRDKAWKYEEKAAAAEKEKDRSKNLKKARREYEKAAGKFEAAVDKDARFHEAFSSLGYARRKLGMYQRALSAYDTALNLAPDYAEAVEYRAEAYLALNRIPEAQRAYYRLVGLDDDGAAKLLSAFSGWAAERRATPVATVTEEQLESVEYWIERKRSTAPSHDVDSQSEW